MNLKKYINSSSARTKEMISFAKKKLGEADEQNKQNKHNMRPQLGANKYKWFLCR